MHNKYQIRKKQEFIEMQEGDLALCVLHHRS